MLVKSAVTQTKIIQQASWPSPDERRSRKVGIWQIPHDDNPTSQDVAVGSIPLAAFLGLGKQNPALLLCHFPFDYVEQYSLDESLSFA